MSKTYAVDYKQIRDYYADFTDIPKKKDWDNQSPYSVFWYYKYDKKEDSKYEKVSELDNKPFYSLRGSKYPNTIPYTNDEGDRDKEAVPNSLFFEDLTNSSVKVPLHMLIHGYAEYTSFKKWKSNSDSLFKELDNNQDNYLFKSKIDKNGKKISGLNESQLKSISKALNYPITVIEGPPGTGKTHTIIGLLATALAKNKDYKIAVISYNNSAINNVESKLNEITDNEEKYGSWLRNLKNKYAKITNKEQREKYFRTNPFNGQILTSSSAGGFELSVPQSYTDEKQIIISTIHSIRKLFNKSGSQDYAYDLVIMDEASQCNVALGMIAYGIAKNIVIIGDTKQLQPIIDEKQINFDNPEYENIPDHLKLTRVENGETVANSILQSTLDAFDKPTTQAFYGEFLTHLNIHYRCHPKIINFSIKNIYGENLQVAETSECTLNDDKSPFNIYRYKGNYNEYSRYKVDNAEEGYNSDGKPKRFEIKESTINAKQISILKYELIEKILNEVLGNEDIGSKSICITSPFWPQTYELYKVLNEEVKNRGCSSEIAAILDNDTDSLDEEELSEVEKIKRRNRTFISIQSNKYIKTQTVSKAQGQEFDIVYFFPVIDGKEHHSPSQNMNLVNVAVTRAKEEFNIIASDRMFDSSLLQEIEKFSNLESKSAYSSIEINSEAKELDLYTTKLFNYIYELDGFNSFKEAKFVSIFDENPKYVKYREEKSIADMIDSAGEFVLNNNLQSIFSNKQKYKIMNQIYCDLIKIDETSQDSNSYIYNMKTDNERKRIENDENPETNHLRYDFGILDENNRVLMLIEIDGSHHRLFIEQNEYDHIRYKKTTDRQDKDKIKDDLVINNGGVVLKNNTREEVKDKINKFKDCSYLLLRLPINGATAFETEKLKQDHPNNKIVDQFCTLEEIFNLIK